MTSTDVLPTLTGWTADDSTFGARLALIRQRMHWGNVKEAAEECGLPVQSWRTWERDGVLPRQLVDVAAKVSDRTGCDLAWLIAGSRLRRRSVTERDTRDRSRPASYPSARTRPDGIRRPVRLSDQVAA